MSNESHKADHHRSTSTGGRKPAYLQPRRILVTTLGAIFLALIAWQFLLPPSLGGQTALVVSTGNSMEPKIKKGDLIVVRKANGPVRQGDPILYQSKTLNRWVLHRVVRVQPDGSYVTKGDNNNFLDSDRPRDSDVIGKMAFRIAGGGKIAGSHTAQLFSALIGLVSLGIWALISFRQGNRSRTAPSLPFAEAASESRMNRVLSAGTWRIGAAAVLIILGVVAAGVLWNKASAKRPPVEIQVSGPVLAGSYTHEADVTYSASEPQRAIQPDGKATTGEAIFPRSSGPISMRVDYRLNGDGADLALASGELKLRVDDQAGWSYTQTLAKGQLRDGTMSLRGTLDLKKLTSRLHAFESASGTVPTQYNVSLTPEISFTKQAPKALRGTKFDPEIQFLLDPKRFRPALLDGASGESQFRPAKTIEGDKAAQSKALAAQRNRVPRNVYRALAIGLLVGSLLLAGFVLSARPRDPEAGAEETLADESREEETLEEETRSELATPHEPAFDQPTVELQLHPIAAPDVEPTAVGEPLAQPIPLVTPRARAEVRPTVAAVEAALERVDAFVVSVPQIRITPAETIVHLDNPLELAAAAGRSDRPVVCERTAVGTRWAVRLGSTCLVFTLTDLSALHQDDAA